MPNIKLLGKTGLIARDVAHVVKHKRFRVAEELVVREVTTLCDASPFEETHSHDEAQQMLFSGDILGLSKRALPQCAPIHEKFSQRIKFRSTKDVLSHEDIDTLTICVACCFSRHSYADMYCIESLNQVRVMLVSILRQSYYRMPDDVLSRSVERNNWPKQQKWACLARVSGLPENHVFEVASKARGFRVAP